MPKKIVNGLLIGFCIAIYGAIFFKAFVKKQVVDNSFTDIPFQKSNFEIQRTEKDSFTLSFTERSPFGETIRTSTSPTLINEKKISSNPKQIVKKAWPRISYFGFVKNTTNNEKLAVVKVNNDLYRKREGEYLNDELKIVKAYSDSIIVSNGTNNKIIIRNIM